MQIAIIGAGNVGTACGGGWVSSGHAVTYGVRDAAAAKYAGLSVAPVSEAVRAAEAILLATPWDATEAALKAAGDLSGKLLLDATKPIVEVGDLHGDVAHRLQAVPLSAGYPAAAIPREKDTS